MPAVAERPKQQALYELHPRQQRAMWLLGMAEPRIAEPVEELLFGGAAGGGKSLWLRALGVTYCWNNPGAVVSLFRRTYPELEETHIRAIQREVPESVARYVSDRHELRFPNGSVLAFRYCEREPDVYRYQSAEWDGLLLDEATHFTGFQVAYLRTRVRSTRIGWRPLIAYGSNPGNAGHAYFKEGFVDAAPYGQPFQAPPEDGGLRRCFLQSKLEQNPSLPADYARQIEGIPDEAMRRALRDGDWDVFVGQFFREWRRETHTCPEFDLPKHWTTRGYSVDWGFGSPWSVHFWVRDEDLWASHKLERWYGYRELYATQVSDEDQADRIKAAKEADEEVARAKDAHAKLVWSAIGDPSMWNNKPNSNASVRQVYQQRGVALNKGNNDRVNGWSRLRSYLRTHRTLPDETTERLTPDGKPLLLFMRERCPEVIRTLPTLVRSATNVEDTLEGPNVEDHCADEIRYWLLSRGDPRTALVGQRMPLQMGQQPTGDKGPTPALVKAPAMYPAGWLDGTKGRR